jgi:hypothetical protein
MNHYIDRKVIVLYVISLVIFTVLVSRCTSDKLIREGTIHYRISYPDFDQEEHPLLYAFLPKSQDVMFKDGQMHTVIKKAVFELNMVTNYERQYFYSDFLFNNWNYFEGTGSELDAMLGSYEKVILEPTDETDQLLGFTIYKTIAKGDEFGAVELWYTRQTNLINPYWYSSYSGVDGLLLKYVLFQNGLKMEFEATRFDPVVADEGAFKKARLGDRKNFEEFSGGLTEIFKKWID